MTDLMKRSFRIDEFAKRNSISRSQAYNEMNEGRLKARKCGAATIITVEAESEWLNSLAEFKPSNAAA